MVKVIRQKYRKYHKVRVLSSDLEFKRLYLLYGFYGLQVLEGVRLTSNQIESIRRTTKRYLRKSGKMWLRILPDRGLTSKPAEVRMGKGKGNYSESVAVVKKGTIILELGGETLQKKIALLVLKYVSQKIPVESRIISYKI